MNHGIRRRYAHIRHPALAGRTHLATTDRDAGDLESLCGGRSQGWVVVSDVKPGGDVCATCVMRRDARERLRAAVAGVRGEDVAAVQAAAARGSE